MLKNIILISIVFSFVTVMPIDNTAFDYVLTNLGAYINGNRYSPGEIMELTVSVSLSEYEQVDIYAVLVFPDQTFISVVTPENLAVEGVDEVNPETETPYDTIGALGEANVLTPIVTNFPQEEVHERYVAYKTVIPDSWPAGFYTWYVGAMKPGEIPFNPNEPIVLDSIEFTISNTTSVTADNDLDIMVLIHGGTYTQGFLDTPYPDALIPTQNYDPSTSPERPAHQVTVNSFYIDRYEVSNTMYAQFLNATQLSDNWDERMQIERTGTPNNYVFTPVKITESYPVTYVSYADATAYAEWSGKRLPTEAEWEFVAAGLEHRRYPWGDDFDPFNANFMNDSSRTQLLPVWWGANGATPDYKIYNLAGNVWEWCSDWYGPYTAEAQTNPTGPAEGTIKIIRGGGYFSSEYQIQNQKRYYVSPDQRHHDIGFRCAKNYQ